MPVFHRLTVPSENHKKGIFGINWKFFTYTRKKSDNFSVYMKNFIKICSDAQRFFQNLKSTFGLEIGKTKENGVFSVLICRLKLQ